MWKNKINNLKNALNCKIADGKLAYQHSFLLTT